MARAAVAPKKCGKGSVLSNLSPHRLKVLNKLKGSERRKVLQAQYEARRKNAKAAAAADGCDHGPRQGLLMLMGVAARTERATQTEQGTQTKQGTQSAQTVAE